MTKKLVGQDRSQMSKEGRPCFDDHTKMSHEYLYKRQQ